MVPTLGPRFKISNRGPSVALRIVTRSNRIERRTVSVQKTKQVQQRRFHRYPLVMEESDS
jgi:hypothetical protein